MATKKCRKCGEVKEDTPEFFPRNKNAPGGIDKMCKACWKAKSADKSVAKDNAQRVKKLTSELKNQGKKAYQSLNQDTNDAPSSNTPKESKISKKNATLIPDDIEAVSLKRFSDLPDKSVQLFEFEGDMRDAIAGYEEKFGRRPSIVYIPSRFFIPHPDDVDRIVKTENPAAPKKVVAKRKGARK